MKHLSHLRSQLATRWEQVRASFWFVPAIMTVGGALLALIVLSIDNFLGDNFFQDWFLIYGGSPDGARSVLTTIASSAITVAGTTFSITIAALTLASSQFGPRLLRTFVRDTGNQVVLGTFVATFLYCLLVVRTIRDLEDTRVVPHLSVTVSVVLAAANLAVLIYFIHHIATTIRADQVIAAVAKDLNKTIDRFFPEQLGQGLVAQSEQADQPAPPPIEEPAAKLVDVARDGYLQALDTERLLKLTIKHDLVITLFYRPGDFIVAREPVAAIYPAVRCDDEIFDIVQGTFVLGHERTIQEDILFAVNQLVEVGARALSPGINDPFTAISCLDRLGAMLHRVAQRSLPDGWHYDDNGNLRVVSKPVRFNELVESAFTLIRTYGRDHLVVITHLFTIVGHVASATDDPARRAALVYQARLGYEACAATLTTDADREILTARYRETLETVEAPGVTRRA